VLPESFSRDADRLRRFELEGRSVAALNHPNILAIHDTGEQNGSRLFGKNSTSRRFGEGHEFHSCRSMTESMAASSCWGNAA
jgi:hypothetical protein